MPKNILHRVGERKQDGQINEAFDRIRELETLVETLESDLKALRGDGGMAFFNGDIDMGGHQIINVMRSATSDMVVTRDELIDLVIDNVILKETITTTGTSHALANTPGDSTKVILLLNGDVMEADGTGQMGYTITATGSITTIRSIDAADEFLAMYVRSGS